MIQKPKKIFQKILAVLTAVCVMISLLTIPVPAFAATLPFTDVGENDWYYPYVERVYKEGLMEGTGKTTFEPEKILTREEYVAVLSRIENADITQYEDADTGFMDVPKGEWYSPYIAWAYENKITEGKGDGTFGLGDPVTREEMAKFVDNYINQFGYPLKKAENPSDPFTDADAISDWAMDAVEAMRLAGIFTGYDDGSFQPQKTTIRGEAAAVFCRVEDAIEKNVHTHSYTSKVTKEATCTEDGIRTYTCPCGDSYTEVIPALGHDWEDLTEKQWVVDGKTWVVDQEAYDEKVLTGYDKYYKCNSCGARFETSDEAGEHLFVCSKGDASYSLVKDPIYETVHHDEEGHYEETGHYETVVIGRKCKRCGLEELK